MCTTLSHAARCFLLASFVGGVPLFGQLQSFAGTPGSTTSGIFDSTSDTPRINYVGSDSHVHQLWIEDYSAWEDFDLTAATGGPLARTGTSVAALDVASYGPVIGYIGVDSHIHEFTLNVRWTDYDLTVPSGAPDVAAHSILSGFSTGPYYSSQCMIYVATDSHVHIIPEYYEDLDLTAITSAPDPIASTGLSGFFDSSSNTLRISYIASDYHMHQFWYSTSETWSDFDLTAATGAPYPASVASISSFFDATSNTPRINYVGGDSHLHQFWIFNQEAWEDFDLTDATGAPDISAEQPLSSFVDQAGKTPRINYVGADYHLHQFWINYNNAAWEDFDLTDATGAPNVATANTILSGFIDSASGTPRISYTANDADIHQFWIADQAAWYDFDLTAATGGPSPYATHRIAH